MKKVIIIACLALMSLVSCSNNASEQEQPIKSVSAETTTGAITTAEVTTTAEPTTEPKADELIFSEQGIEVYYHDLDENVINLNVVNSNEQNILLYLSEININGNDIDITYFEKYVPENTSVTCRCEIPLEKLQDQNITSIKELKFNVSARLGDTLIDKTENCTITR